MKANTMTWPPKQQCASEHAITNAVVDALSHYGISHIDMPTTPNRIWGLIRYGARTRCNVERDTSIQLHQEVSMIRKAQVVLSAGVEHMDLDPQRLCRVRRFFCVNIGGPHRIRHGQRANWQQEERQFSTEVRAQKAGMLLRTSETTLRAAQ
jgi:hypothetical protein